MILHVVQTYGQSPEEAVVDISAQVEVIVSYPSAVRAVEVEVVSHFRDSKGAVGIGLCVHGIGIGIHLVELREAVSYLVAVVVAPSHPATLLVEVQIVAAVHRSADGILDIHHIVGR